MSLGSWVFGFSDTPVSFASGQSLFMWPIFPHRLHGDLFHGAFLPVVAVRAVGFDRATSECLGGIHLSISEYASFKVAGHMSIFCDTEFIFSRYKCIYRVASSFK